MATMDAEIVVAHVTDPKELRADRWHATRNAALQALLIASGERGVHPEEAAKRAAKYADAAHGPLP